jgi:hypothetical protein
MPTDRQSRRADAKFEALRKKFGGDVVTDKLTYEHKQKIIRGELQCFPVVSLPDGSTVGHSFEVGGWIRIM